MISAAEAFSHRQWTESQWIEVVMPLDKPKVCLNSVSKSGQVPKLGGVAVRTVCQKVVVQVRAEPLVM